MTTSHFSLPPSTRLQSLKGQNQELWFSRFRPMISTWVLMARWKQTHICTLKYGKSANVPLPAWSLERDVNNLFFSCICPNVPPSRYPTPYWRIVVGTTSISVLTQNWDSSTHRLCLTVRPKAPTYWKFSLWMAGNLHGLGNMDSRTLVSNTHTAQNSLWLNWWLL